jgi:signal transduction histidine kinase
MPDSRQVSIATQKLHNLISANEDLAAELVVTNKEIIIENENLYKQIIILNNKLADQDIEKNKRADELVIANNEIIVQEKEKTKRAAALVAADIELTYQQAEKGKRAAERIIADSKLAFETERGNRAAELIVLNRKLSVQNLEMEHRAAELAIANREKIELLAQLLQSQKMESLGILAGGIAHDMNNILGAILSLASAHLTFEPRSSRAFPAFETMRDAALRGREMVKRLLNFARQASSENKVMDLNAVIEEQVRLLEYTTLAKVHLEMDLAPNLQPIQGDASALAHLFMNLCVNSVEAMEEGGTLTLCTRDVGGGLVEAEVADTGCGMSKDVLEKAMVPFFTTKEVGKGTGLGLAIVYSTVKAHHGLLAIQSEPGRGTLVRLTFPAAATRLPEAAPDGLRLALATRAERPLTVLVVDDDDLILRTTQILLDTLGHSVTTAPSGEEALARLAGGLQPDVVILDVNMPGLGGKRTLPQLRNLFPELPILLATGRPDEAVLKLTDSDPNITILAKPFTIEELNGQLLEVSRGLGAKE